MTPGLLYLIIFCGVTMLIACSIGFYFAGKGKGDSALAVILIGLMFSVLFGFAPGISWHGNKVDVTKSTQEFNKHYQGTILEAKKRQLTEYRITWVDQEGKLRTSIVFLNPWGESIAVEGGKVNE